MGFTTGMTIIPIMVLGIILFVSIAVTAILGYLVLKGKAKFRAHKTMAMVTIVILIIHGTVAAAYFLGL